MSKKLLIILSIAVLLIPALKANVSDNVYFTTGFKVGELTANSVLIWTQLCKESNPVSIKHKQKPSPFRGPIDFDNDVYIVCGDRHWQYVSQDKKTGVMEFSCGPASDAHSQGWKQSDLFPEHKFLRVKGGFLAVKVCRENDNPILKFTHYDVDGNIVNEEVITRNK